MEVSEILSRRELYKKRLFEEDMQLFNQYVNDGFTSTSMNNSIIDSVCSIGYTRDQSRLCLALAMWHYTINESEYIYRNNIPGYIDTVKDFIASRSAQEGVQMDDVIALASYYHYLNMQRFNNEILQSGEDMPMISYKTGEGRWWDCTVPNEWGYYHAVLNDGNELFCKLLTINPQFKPGYNEVEFFRNNTYRNLNKVYGFSVWYGDDSVSNLVFEAVDYFVQHQFHVNADIISYPLHLSLFILDKRIVDPIKIKEIISCGYCVDGAFLMDLIDTGYGCSLNSSNVLKQEARWKRWRKIELPPIELSYLIIAMCLQLLPSYRKLFDYYYRRLAQYPICQQFLNDYCKLKEILYKCNEKTLTTYIQQRAVSHIYIGPVAEDLIFDEWDASRDIKTIIADLDFEFDEDKPNEVESTKEITFKIPENLNDWPISGESGEYIDEPRDEFEKKSSYIINALFEELTSRGIIDNRDKTKQLFTFRLTGRCRPEGELRPIKVNANGGNIIIFIVQQLFLQNKRKYSLMKNFFEYDHWPDEGISGYASSAPPKFKEKLKSMMDS